MLSIENAHPTAKQMLENIDEIESFCMGDKSFSPSRYREINEELSIGAVLMLGKHRYQKDVNGKRLFWKGLDEREHDMGLVNDVYVTRDYPGFHASRSRALGGDNVSHNKIIPVPNGKGNVSVVTMKDGTKGIGHNYKIALRNAALKMHLKSKLNHLSLASIWDNILGHA